MWINILYGWEDLSNAAEFAQIQIPMGEICLLKVGLLDWGKSNPDFSKENVVFSPKNFLNRFKGYLGVKTKSHNNFKKIKNA